MISTIERSGSVLRDFAAARGLQSAVPSAVAMVEYGREKVGSMAATDGSMTRRVDNHEVRIMALESRVRTNE